MPRRRSYTFPGHTNEINALRRTLINRLTMLAPNTVNIEQNTTANTDEFIAQRIGMIPFVQDGDESECSTLEVSGRNAVASDFVGRQAVYPDVIVAVIDHNQTLKLSVDFSKGQAITHARFAKACAVGMIPEKKGATISFETLLPDDHATCLQEACAALETYMTDIRATLVE